MFRQCGRYSWLLLSFVFTACHVGPTYISPELELPCEWNSPLSDGLEIGESEQIEWWENFQDPVLNSLMERAECQNLDLSIAVTRILQVRIEKQAKSASAYPRIDFSANYDHVYYSKNALVKGLLDTAGKCKDQHVKRNVNFFEIGFDAEWEIDLFGMAKHEMQALEAQEQAAEESFRDVWITLSAEIARTYIELRGHQKGLLLLDKNLESHKALAELNLDLVSGGVISELDASSAENQLQTLAAQRPVAEFAISKSIHHLSILLGYAPGDLFTELKAENCSTPSLPCRADICVPSELLRRRPDVRRAERELAAATEKVGSAIASLFPRFSLRGFIGEISTNIGSIFSPASLMWVAGPQILMPIFNSRLIVESVNYNKVLTQKALYEYQKAVLIALEEAENAIAAFHSEAAHLTSLDKVYEGTKSAVALTQQLFRSGVKNYMDVLGAIKQFIDAENAYNQAQINQFLNYVALYKALGTPINLCEGDR